VEKSCGQRATFAIIKIIIPLGYLGQMFVLLAPLDMVLNVCAKRRSTGKSIWRGINFGLKLISVAQVYF